ADGVLHQHVEAVAADVVVAVALPGAVAQLLRVHAHDAVRAAVVLRELAIAGRAGGVVRAGHHAELLVALGDLGIGGRGHGAHCAVRGERRAQAFPGHDSAHIRPPKSAWLKRPPPRRPSRETAAWSSAMALRTSTRSARRSSRSPKRTVCPARILASASR